MRFRSPFFFEQKPSILPSPEKITSDINMTRAFPKSVETSP